MSRPAGSLRTLLIDNYDSFTYNLAHHLGEGGAEVVVVRNDDPAWRPEHLAAFDSVVLSPGPGTPARPADFGICADALRTSEVPTLGVCLGHEGLCHVFGGSVVAAPEPYHGRTSTVWHDGDGLFAGIPSPFEAVRYHSLVASDIPEVLEVTARTADGLPMALRHRTRPLLGVQFHPESIGTDHGPRLLRNFQVMAAEHRARREGRPDDREWHEVRSVLVPGQPPAAAATDARAAATLRVLTRRLAVSLDPEAAFHELYRASTTAYWLDSGIEAGPGTYSIMGDAEGPLARRATVDVGRGEITVRTAAGEQVHRANVFDWLRDDLASCAVEVPPLPFDFALGWVGALGYELKAHGSGRAAHRSAIPDACLVFADRAVVFEHGTGAVHLLALAEAGDEGLANEWLDATERRLAGTTTAPPVPASAPEVGPARLRHDRRRYLELIEESQREIAAGESYEICLTNMVEVDGSIDPWSAYRTLRRQNPVPFGAFLRFGDVSVLSCSPERLLRVDAAGNAESKPIKGTRRRGATTAEDEALRDDLATSTKDRAENLMIVDLVRNDHGSVAELGSVTVARLFDIESYSTVHQLVSTVRSTLRAGVHAVDCLRALFPAGSMTGAPKIRTMQIIDRLEAGPRGLYSGCVGYLSLSGALDLSVTIRTLVATPGRLSFGVGGAITVLSDPGEEFEETAVKAAALLRLIGQHFPDREPIVR